MHNATKIKVWLRIGRNRKTPSQMLKAKSRIYAFDLMYMI